MQHRMYLSPRTPQPFRREERYYVLKISDMRKYLSAEKQEAVHDMAGKINAGRAVDGKAFLQAVVVEHDWPEYERVWRMIETRMTTTQAQPFNPNDDRRFWPIPVSRVKGNNGAPKPLLWRCSCGTKFWVRVNESHCPRCGKKCQMTQEPDLSQLQPETQKQIREWIADGTFIERAIGVMLDQERLLRDAEKQEPVAWMHSKTGYLYKTLEEVPPACDGEWPEPLYNTPPLLNKPLKDDLLALLKKRRADTHSCYLLTQDVLALLAKHGIKE